MVNAYLDSELDPAATLDVERRIRTDATLKAEYDRLVNLRQAIATHVPKNAASAELHRRIVDIGGPATRTELSVRPVRRAAKSFDWRQMAAAVVIAASLASGVTYLGLRPSSQMASVAAIVGSHQRALLAAEPYDVASSDRHTVKPWFDSKLALSPRVVDLASAGFPLAGGRIDTIDRKSVPALVYHRREHIISVIAIPRLGDNHSGYALTHASKDGYTLLGWQAPDFDYYAVSDVAEGDLEAFVSQWRTDTTSK